MKEKIKVILAIFMTLCMLFAAVGCTGNEPEVDSEQVVMSDDFFKDETEDEINTESENNNESSKGDKTTESSATTSTSKDGADKSGSTSTVPTENQVGGKTWQQVLKSMPKKLRGTTMVMYNWNPASEYTGAPVVIEEFTKQTGIKVDWKTISYNVYTTKLASLVASGEGIPDVVRTNGPKPSNMLSYQPISTANFDFSDEAWDETIMDMYTVGDKVYATSLKNTHIGGCTMMLYNKSEIDKYDFEDPYKLWKSGKWTWSKFLKMAREYKDETGNKAVYGEAFMKVFATSYGLQGSMSYDGKKFTNVITSKKFVTVHQELCDLYNKESLFGFGGTSIFDEGDTLFCTGGAVHLRRKNSYFGALKESNNLYAVPMPTIDGQKKYYQDAGEAEAYAIAKGAPNAEAVPYFLRYFLDGSNYELGTYFCNEQNLEVYNWCMNQKNKIYNYGYGEGIDGLTADSLQSQVGGNVASYVARMSPTVNKNVDAANGTLAKLK